MEGATEIGTFRKSRYWRHSAQQKFRWFTGLSFHHQQVFFYIFFNLKDYLRPLIRFNMRTDLWLYVRCWIVLNSLLNWYIVCSENTWRECSVEEIALSYYLNKCGFNEGDFLIYLFQLILRRYIPMSKIDLSLPSR